MTELRSIYAEKALAQIPRLLSCQDRNRFSPTYGCMNREFWLCRSTDFPSAIAQFGTHALALVYANSLPNNPYYQQPKILDWALAGMDYWTRIQHRDGSFDEFYPNERGWAGPTGFLLYSMCETYNLLEKHISPELKERFLTAAHRAALFLSRNDESGTLANHHAMALLPMYEAFLLVQDKSIERAFWEKLNLFFTLCHKEGWCLEYDGVDPGYLSATISFMAKLAKHYRDERFLPFFKKAVEFSSYFVYPNGHYGGTLGSRQTLHFYPHGYERLAGEFPLAAAIADKMLLGLQQGALVPPEIQEERYFVYRIPEFLLAYIDYGPRPMAAPLLPYEQKPFRTYFPGACLLVDKRPQSYTLINAAKGGVVKQFDLPSGRLRVNHCGVLGKLQDGTVFTSQWIDKSYAIHQNENTLTISGRCHKIPTKVFNPFTFILFRGFILIFGWQERWAYALKGLIRRLLMLGSKPVPVTFTRTIKTTEEGVEIQTSLQLEGHAQVLGLQCGDEFPARYVPQSRYFQSQELTVNGYLLNEEELKQLNREGKFTLLEKFKSGNWERTGSTIPV